MRRLTRLLCAGVLAVGLLALPAIAVADPSDNPEDHDHGSHSHDGPPQFPLFDGPAFSNMLLVGNSDKDGAVNSDLAFWEDLAVAGNYNGFRILNIRDPENPVVLSDYFCRSPQGDPSIYKLKNRLILITSIDTPQTKAECDGTPAGSSRDTPISSGQRAFGFEGLRIFDITDPTAPKFLTGVPTACGSHTHTTIPDIDNQRVLVYVSSYPLGSGITPAGGEAPAGLRCQSPHQKISIVEVPAANPAASFLLREERLSDDTDPYPGAGGPLAPPFKACHDITAYMKERIAVGSCAGDAQIWDISRPENPTAEEEGAHTHYRNPSNADRFEFVHNAVISLDGRFIGVADETGGGGTAECDGSPPEGTPPGGSQDGFYYFYKRVDPGQPQSPLLSRFMIPRPQSTQICVSHNGNVIPTRKGYLMTSAYYQGGNTVIDFTNPARPREIAYSDPEGDTIGDSDSWSTYWYNDYIYANGGLDRRGPTRNRGLDVFRLLDENGKFFRARKWHHSNPQTIEVFQTVWDDGSNNNPTRQPGDGIR